MSENQSELEAPDDVVSNRTILKWVFWIWGAVGSASIGVGTSAYLMVGILLWIGGMILFGIAALLAERVPSI